MASHGFSTDMTATEAEQKQQELMKASHERLAAVRLEERDVEAQKTRADVEAKTLRSILVGTQKDPETWDLHKHIACTMGARRTVYRELKDTLQRLLMFVEKQERKVPDVVQLFERNLRSKSINKRVMDQIKAQQSLVGIKNIQCKTLFEHYQELVAAYEEESCLGTRELRKKLGQVEE